MHGYNDFGLSLKEVEEGLELIFNVAKFEERRGVVSVLTFCAAAFFLVTLANEAGAVFNGFVVKGLISKPF